MTKNNRTVIRQDIWSHNGQTDRWTDGADNNQRDITGDYHSL